jgi:hypothetical protein
MRTIYWPLWGQEGEFMAKITKESNKVDNLSNEFSKLTTEKKENVLKMVRRLLNIQSVQNKEYKAKKVMEK